MIKITGNESIAEVDRVYHTLTWVNTGAIELQWGYAGHPKPEGTYIDFQTFTPYTIKYCPDNFTCRIISKKS